MGKGGQHDAQKGGAAATHQLAMVDAVSDEVKLKSAVNGPPPVTSSPPHEGEVWVSPFTADRMDPKRRKDLLPGNTEEIISKINAEFPTKSEIRAVIPPHCFERSLLRSFSYAVRDVLQGIFVWYVTYHVIGLSTDPPEGGLFRAPLSWLVWRLAWNLYAAAMTIAVGGLWVVAHECSHGAFSKYPMVNGAVGWIFHSAMLVPYWSWAFSHAKHHRRTNDMMEGETHNPQVHTEWGLDKNFNRLPNEVIKERIYGGTIHEGVTNNLMGHARFHDMMGDEGFAIFMLWSRLGWAWQVYLCGVKGFGRIGADGKPLAKGVRPDHFRPHSRLFPKKMYWKVVASDVGVGIMATALIYYSWMYGFRAVWMWYFGPYILVNAFLVTVTWLHHTDPTVPQFDTANWTWMKGAIAGTIDRPLYGWMNTFSHNISTTHVVHHLFHEIPHYHAVEATKHVRAYLEPKGLYNYDPTPATLALWKVCRKCHYVDSLTDGVKYYLSLEDIPRTKKEKSVAASVEKKEQ